MEVFQEYIYKSRYARLNDKEGRREDWNETVARYCDFWKNLFGDLFPYWDVYNAIYDEEVMPSMRAMMTAGQALARDHVAGYNCAYLPIDNVRAFDEMMYILMCGTGVGFSVERQNIAKLPEVAHEFHRTDTTIVVGDSKIGWASALRELLALLYAGKIPAWDLSKVRASGERLKTFGGRASGPGPLDDLFHFLVSVFTRCAGRRLNSVEVHDICCKIADVVVVGGVRRSALISLSNLTDERMQRAKMGQWWEDNGQRALANNSTAYTEKPDVGIFLREWGALYDSKSGERGIFNRVAAQAQCKSTGRREHTHEFGTNPCGEIILRPHQFCNLSEVIIREYDTEQDLLRKVRIASIIGTFQSTLTNFRYLRPIWRKNCEEERLLGVSLTGIMDNKVTAGRTSTGQLENLLRELKDHVNATNKEYAARLGINVSVATTTVKPSGTVSQLVDSGSGIHARYAPFYLRTVRADKKDPLSLFLREMGVYVEDDATKAGSTDVFYFPQKAPTSSVTRKEMSALDQLAHYMIYKKVWCEHNPSITVYVTEDEWMDVGAWVYKNFNDIGGISFLPFSDHIYRQAPYQEISEKEYHEWVLRTPKEVDWHRFKETDDNTTSSQEFACVGTSCEVM